MKFETKSSENNILFRNGFLVICMLAGLSRFVNGQGINFELVTGTLKDDDAKCIIQTLDSGYMVVGSTSAFGSGQSDVYLTKISKAGTVSWQQAIGGAGVDKGNSVIQTPDSGFAIAGYSNSAGTGGYDVYLARTDKDGILLWEKYYGGIDWDFGNSIIQTTAGNFVICGNTYSYGQGNGDVYLLKTDSAGTLLWDSAYGGTMEDIGNSVCPTTDGGYFTAGTTRSFGQGSEDIYLLKSDSTGNLKWSKTYGGTGKETTGECKLTSDGRFIVVGSTNSFSALTKHENWLMKINSIGDTLWTRRDNASYNRIPTSVSQTMDGGYIFTGQDDNAGQYNIFLYKTDDWGYYQDYKNYGGTKKEDAVSVKQAFDKGYVVLSITESYGAGTPNVYVLKTDSNRISSGTVQVVVSVVENEPAYSAISVYPNPASDYFTVNVEKKCALEMYDALGRIISSLSLVPGKNNIAVSTLPQGLYFIQIRNEENTLSGKIIVGH